MQDQHGSQAISDPGLELGGSVAIELIGVGVGWLAGYLVEVLG